MWRRISITRRVIRCTEKYASILRNAERPVRKSRPFFLQNTIGIGHNHGTKNKIRPVQKSRPQMGAIIMRRFVPVALFVLLTGCTTTVPVAVIGPGGLLLRGTATASISGGSFQVTDGKLTCAGTYDSLDMSTTITMAVHCNDGRKGFVVATRDANGRDGSGTVTLNDGTKADFVFGHAAAAL